MKVTPGSSHASDRMARRNDLVPAALVAGLLSGAPSTLHALVTRQPLRATVAAAGELLGRPGVVRGVVAHTVVTIGWTSVLLVVLPRRATIAWGAVAGAAIGLADLAVADRRFPAIAALPRLPQLADHVAFGALVGAVVAVRSGGVHTAG
jgi:hypothetical protein